MQVRTDGGEGDTDHRDVEAVEEERAAQHDEQQPDGGRPAACLTDVQLLARGCHGRFVEEGHADQSMRLHRMRKHVMREHQMSMHLLGCRA